MPNAVAVVLPCNRYKVILRKLFSVAAAVDVHPLGVNDAVNVERFRTFAIRIGEILHRHDGAVRVVVVLVRAPTMIEMNNHLFEK